MFIAQATVAMIIKYDYNNVYSKGHNSCTTLGFLGGARNNTIAATPKEV